MSVDYDADGEVDVRPGSYEGEMYGGERNRVSRRDNQRHVDDVPEPRLLDPTTLPEYWIKAKCPKCAQEDAATRWMPRGESVNSTFEEPETVDGEFMARQCRNCGYCWMECPLDAPL